MNILQQIKNASSILEQNGITEAEVGIVLGTGLGKLVNEMDIIKTLSYTDIPHFPEATVEFHDGKLIYGTLSGKKVIAMQGRFHFYEGYSMKQVTFPIRVMKALGVKSILLSGAAGAMNLSMKKGDLMMITDHINLLPDNPLIGENHEELGPRFPDMSEAYSKHINGIITEEAQRLSIDLKSGVYVSVMGPNLETPAEYRFLHRIGADAVGMSTVPEVIVANHAGIPCATVIVLTDECDPDNLKPVNIQEIIEVAGKAELKLIELFRAVVARLWDGCCRSWFEIHNSKLPKPFKFKQFEIQQESAAFKIGTDACLLGAFVDIDQPKRILDIGTGTGVIALMLAQRYGSAKITGIEQDEQSAMEASFNAGKSPWKNRLQITQGDFLSAEFEKEFDLIVSNPPFFKASTKNPDARKSSARHEADLTIENLLSKSRNLISEKGVLALILPIERRLDVLNSARSNGLHEQHLIEFKPTDSKPVNRFISLLSKTPSNAVKTQEITIYSAPGAYSQEVFSRFQPFYLYLWTVELFFE